jgi:hypothetical protein
MNPLPLLQELDTLLDDFGEQSAHSDRFMPMLETISDLPPVQAN